MQYHIPHCPPLSPHPQQNFSTKSTRAAGTGWDAIQAQIEKLGKRHAVHIAAYGEGNERRLTGM